MARAMWALGLVGIWCLLPCASGFISRPVGSRLRPLETMEGLNTLGSRGGAGSWVAAPRRSERGGSLKMVLPWRPDLKMLFPKPPQAKPSTKTANIVLMAGFEAFNLALYRQAADKILEICPSIRVVVFTDRDVMTQPAMVAAALEEADVFFGSLLFDYDQVCILYKSGIIEIYISATSRSGGGTLVTCRSRYITKPNTASRIC